MALTTSMGGGTIADGVADSMGPDGDFSQSSSNSWEQIFTPIQIQKTHPHNAATPGFRAPSIGLEEFGGFGSDGVSPTIHELDPYFAQIWGDDGESQISDIDFRIVSHDNEGSATEDFNLNKDNVDANGEPDRTKVYRVRPNALRGPLILSGWGFGVDDFPVPGKSETMPDKAAFDPNLRNDRAKWKTGPVHLMWDDERQVWQGGYPIVCGVAISAINPPASVCQPSSFDMRILRNTGGATGAGGGGGDDEGRLSDAFNETITVMNRDPSLEQSFVENAIFVIAIKLNYEWIPLWVGCPETPHCDCTDQPAVPPCLDFYECPGDSPCAGPSTGDDISLPTKEL